MSCFWSFTDPLPMRMRALPQSFWQQPNVPQNVSPASSYPVLPPLIIKEAEDGVISELAIISLNLQTTGRCLLNPDTILSLTWSVHFSLPQCSFTYMYIFIYNIKITNLCGKAVFHVYYDSPMGSSLGVPTEQSFSDVRPITPPEERRDREPVRDRDREPVRDRDREPVRDRAKPEPSVNLIKLEKTDQSQKYGREKAVERKITVANTDLLFRLFDNIEGKDKKVSSSIQLKRGR